MSVVSPPPPPPLPPPPGFIRREDAEVEIAYSLRRIEDLLCELIERGKGDYIAEAREAGRSIGYDEGWADGAGCDSPRPAPVPPPPPPNETTTKGPPPGK